MRRWTFLFLTLAAAQFISGCAVAHRYPAYRGRVLELGTDKPIEGAGVLAVYDYRQYSGIDVHSAYLGYQAVLTKTDGKFEVPAVWFTKLMPFSWFDNNVRITIYKRGYGNFTASFHDHLPKHGVTEPKLGPGLWVPSNTDVTFWLPKLETEEEIKAHDGAFSPPTTEVLDEKDFPPPGTTKGQFLSPDY